MLPIELGIRRVSAPLFIGFTRQALRTQHSGGRDIRLSSSKKRCGAVASLSGTRRSETQAAA